MRTPVFLFTGCSHLPDQRMAAGGWVAVCGGEIRFGNRSWSGVDKVSDAELASAREATRSALDAFPRATDLLVSTDGSDVQFGPWGDASDGMDQTLDATGMLGECRARGVRHAVRWWPGHRPGPDACDFAMIAARALAMLGRRGSHRTGRVDARPGWRSGLMAAIGPEAVAGALKGRGLTHGQVAALTGLDGDKVGALVRNGHLVASGRGWITLPSAITLRDEAERSGYARWPAEDFGQGHLDALKGTPAERLFVGTHVFGHALGVAVARTDAAGAAVSSERFELDHGGDAYRDSMPVIVGALTRCVGNVGPGGYIDVVTTDPWLAKLLTGLMAPTGGVASAVDALVARAGSRDLVLRPRAIKEDLLRRWHGNASLGLLAASCAAARIAAVDGPFQARSTSVHGDDGILAQAAAGLSSRTGRLIRERQAAVTAALFDLVPLEGEARATFESLASAVHEAYRGNGMVLRPVLPGSVEGRIGLVGKGGASPCGESYGIGPELAARWRTWWEGYALIQARYPDLRLREALLRIDETTDLGTWSDTRLRSVLSWIEHAGEPCPFDVPSGGRVALSHALSAAVEECGGWPFVAGHVDMRTAA